MWKGSTLICPDDVLNAVFVFREDGEGGNMKLAELLDVQGEYKDGFISVDEKQRAGYEQAGMLFYILCNATICDDGDIVMSASLPKIQYMDADRKEVGVFNQPCIIRHSLSRTYKDIVVPLDFNLFGDDYFYKHFQFSVSRCHAIMGCQQLTWPMEYEPTDYRGIANKDPFMAGYYNTPHPIMASFNAYSGKLEHRFGCLDASAAEMRTGYYYVSQLSCANNREVAYTDGYSGRVYICDSADMCRPKAVYSAFALDTVGVQLPDTSLFYTFEYAGKFNNYYYRNIVDVQFNDSSILCLVSIGPVGEKADGKLLVHIDRNTMRRTTRRVPTSASDICMGFKVEGSSIRLFKIVRDAGRYKVLVSA